MSDAAPYLLGIDLGTSAAKAVVVDATARVVGVGTREYPLLAPEPEAAEQDPENWWRAVVDAVGEALGEAERDLRHPVAAEVAAIGLDGQMHGGLFLNRDGQPLGNAIVWPDRRSGREVQDMIDHVGAENLVKITGTLPATGFLGPTLLWLARRDPKRLDACRSFVFPKDEIRRRLVGAIATDPTDASASGLYDIAADDWSAEIIGKLDLPAEILPPVIPSTAVAGHLLAESAGVLGLPPGIPVAAGCADQAAQATAQGLTVPGAGSVTLGSGGQLLVPLVSENTPGDPRFHLFRHAPPNMHYALGAMLTAGLSLRWLRNLLGLQDDPGAYEALSSAAATVPAGSGGLLFLPYLAGERSPVMDSRARGVFAGLDIAHGRGEVARSVMEGVAFALRQIRDAMGDRGLLPESLRASGNGLAAPLWRQIVADVLGIPLTAASVREPAGTGAAMIGGLAAGIYPDFEYLRSLTPEPRLVAEPKPAATTYYDDVYENWKNLYPRAGRLRGDTP